MFTTHTKPRMWEYMLLMYYMMWHHVSLFCSAVDSSSYYCSSYLNTRFQFYAHCVTTYVSFTTYGSVTPGNKQLFKLNNAVTFKMLHCVITFDKKWQNLPNLVISYKVIRENKKILTSPPPKLLFYFFTFF